MRRAAKVDANQAEIVAALRAIGATVTSLATVGNGCPDIVVGYRGINLLYEIKDGRKPKSARALTEKEKAWHAAWAGQACIVESVDEAIDGLLNASRSPHPPATKG